MTKLEELRKYCATYIGPDEIVMGMFNHAGKPELPKDPKIIHTVVFKLKESPQFSGLFSAFNFRKAGLFPFSKELEQVLFRLETARMIGTVNPSYEKYELKLDMLGKALDRFNGEEQLLIKELGQSFSSMIDEMVDELN